MGSGREQLEVLFDRYGPVVLHRARKLLGNESEAWDVVQEVFRRMLERKTHFWENADPLPFLYRATTNAAIDLWRRTARHPEELTERSASSADVAASAESRQMLQQLVGKLTERQVSIVTYLALDGMTQDEIAQVLDVSRKTVVRELAAVREIARSLGWREDASHG